MHMHTHCLKLTAAQRRTNESLAISKINRRASLRSAAGTRLPGGMQTQVCRYLEPSRTCRLTWHGASDVMQNNLACQGFRTLELLRGSSIEAFYGFIMDFF